MSATTELLFTRVVVRRMAAGATPFGWEVYKGDTVVPLHVSTDRFRSMEAAYQAGRTKLSDFSSKARPTQRR
jgi:hypothetical protein